MMTAVFWGIGGMLVLLAIALVFSADRGKISIRTVGMALLVQVAVGALALYWPMGRRMLELASDGVQYVIDASAEGIEFLFDPLHVEGPFALQVLPVIIFVASLASVLYYIGVLEWMVRIIGGAFAKLFGTTQAESMNTAANIFLGQTEAPLVIKPYLKQLKQSELLAVMTGGMATVAGAVLVAYSLMDIPMEFLIAAVFMAAPGALLIAKILLPAGAELPLDEPKPRRWWQRRKHSPETTVAAATASSAPAAESGSGVSSDTGSGSDEGIASSADTTSPEEAEAEDGPANIIDAAARGAGEGLKLALNIGAMLLAFISIIALLNLILGGVGGLFGAENLTLQNILGWVFAPIMFLIGVPWDEAIAAGSFVGQKLVLNEFVAFSEFGEVIDDFTLKTQAIITFALTGFANFAAIAMQIGGIGTLAPNQRSRIAQLGMRAVLAGTLANLMSACIAGIMISLGGAQ